MNKRTGVFANGLIWFGAAVSIAEIEAGFSIGGNVAALIVGHILGGTMLFAAGLVGATSGKNAMETTERTFGKAGMRFFALLNLAQLIGWTAVMIAQGGDAVSTLTGFSPLWPCVILAVLIGAWIFIGFGDKLHLAAIAMGLLALLSIVLTWKLLGIEKTAGTESVGFWPAFEVSIAMPLSWLPLISDYTSAAKRPHASTAVSAIVYTAVSIWMYAVGMMLSYIGASSVADGIIKSGIGIAGLIVVGFSTVTTTFLDAYSAGETSKAIYGKTPPRLTGVIVCAIGCALAVSGIMGRYINFLYLVSSVFAPMAAVLVIDHYFVKKGLKWWNLSAWLAGFLTYQFAGSSPLGPTLSSILVAAIAAAIRCRHLSIFIGIQEVNHGS